MEYPCPPTFLSHIQQARLEFSRKNVIENLPVVDSTLQPFISRASPLQRHYWSLFNIDVKEISTIPKRDFALAIADIPYGYKLRGSTLDDTPYKYKEIDHMIKSFKELTQSPIWRFIIFHSTSQSAAVATALKEHAHAFETMCW